MHRSSKIYIAGHTGLVGSAIWNCLRKKGYSNLIGRTHRELDLTNQQQVTEFFSSQKPEYIILAAAKVGGIVANNTFRGQFIYENLQIQNNVIHQAYIHKAKKLLFLGSTCIYPRNAPQPIKEEYLLTGPLEYTNEPYAIAKIAGLKMCESYNLQYGTNFLSVMPTNLYGPNDNFDLKTSHVLPALVRKIHLAKCLENNNWEAIKSDLAKRPVDGTNGNSSREQIIHTLNMHGIVYSGNSCSIKIWGTGAPLREFLWSEEMAEASVFLMENIDFSDLLKMNKDTTPDKAFHINIGTGSEISIKALAELIKEKIEFKGDLHFDSTKPDGSPRKLTDVSILHKLGWRHKITVEDGIPKLYQWYLSNPDK